MCDDPDLAAPLVKHSSTKCIAADSDTIYKSLTRAMRCVLFSFLAANSANALVEGAQPFAPADRNAPVLMGLGDSLGQGVQSADASSLSQPHSYLNRIATQMGVTFELPLITWSFRNHVFYHLPHLRRRINPRTISHNLAYNGADLNDLIHTRSNAFFTPLLANSEADLVLYPRRSSQIDIAEQAGAGLIICWIGNNDFLPAVLALDTESLTSVKDFKKNFKELATRLTNAQRQFGTKVVFINLPDPTHIAYLVNNHTLAQLLGAERAAAANLPAGAYTTIIAAMGMQLGILEEDFIEQSNHYLNRKDIALVQRRVNQFNDIIATEAARMNMPVVNINSQLEAVTRGTVQVADHTFSLHYMRGIYSLDGVHPSNIGYALIANHVLRTINQFFKTTIPLIPDQQLTQILYDDPFVDLDRDGRVRGRPYTSLLESLLAILNLTGDETESIPPHTTLSAALTVPNRAVQPKIPPISSQIYLNTIKTVLGINMFKGSN